MDRLAQGLQKLQEDDLLQVVRIVTEHKTPEMYVKNDLEGTFPLFFLAIF
jgi:transcription initiation factor TFIID/TFIIF subunit